MGTVRASDGDLLCVGDGWKLCQAFVADTVSTLHFSAYRGNTGYGSGDNLRFASGCGM